MKTILKDRVLWFDGQSSFNIKELSKKYLSGDYDEETQITHVDNAETRLFAEINKDFLIKKDLDITNIDPTVWNIGEFIEIDLEEHLLSLLKNDLKYNESTRTKRSARFIEEFNLISEFSLENFIKTAIYIVYKMRETNQVWGVGRGSACASYILYLIGIHDVDPIKYDLDCYDFFRHK